MKRILKYFTILFVTIVSLIISFVIYQNYKNSLTFNKINNYSKTQFEEINLDNEIKNQQEISLYSQNCSYDYKVKKTRCATRRTNYYISQNDPYSEFQKVDNYLNSLGWKKEFSDSNNNLDTLKRVGKLPSEIYIKQGEYKLLLFLQFLGEEDYSYQPVSDLDYKFNELIDNYYIEGQSLYRISVSTDFVY